MQYGAAGTRNLATGLVHWGYSNKRNTKNHDDGIDQTFLGRTLRQLHNETREDQEQEERRRTTGSGQNDNRERKVTRRESRNIKLQVEKIEGLTYDTIGTVRTLTALQQISQRSSWYHRAAETAKLILNFRQAASRRWINRGIEASKGVMWVGNSDEVDIDGIWDGMKIHAWKTNDAIKAAKLLLREYPPPRCQREYRSRSRANGRTDIGVTRHSAKPHTKTPKTK
jgi:hypothetical protein